MRLSTTDIYAFQSLAYLGTQPLENWVGSDTISEVTGIHRPYLVRILATLSSNEIIISKKGAGGGYTLSKAAKDINLRDVMRAIDGPVAPLSCVSLKWGKECPEQDRCHARNHIWLRVRDAMLAALAEVTVEDLATDFQRGITYRLCLEHLLSPQA
jgi:Rrf2 family transcriptional regulator, cysteine metabolism repressor